MTEGWATMGHRAVGRVGAATGLVFVVLSLLAGFVYPQQPRNDSPAATTMAWVHGHRVSLQVGMLFGLFAAGVLLWFVGILRNLFDEDDHRGHSLAPMVFGAGIAVALVSALAALPIALLAYMDAQPLGLTDQGVVRMLGDLNTVLFAASSIMTAVFLLALGLAFLRRELPAPSWLGWLSLIVAALNAVVVWVAVTFSTYHGKAWNGVGFGAFIGYLVVVLITSVLLMARPRVGPDATPSVAGG